MPADDAVLGLLAELDAEQRRLRDLLAGKDEALLAERPPSGKWSVLENVRHLVFAELAHHSYLLPDGRAWTTTVLPPHGLAIQLRQKMVGDARTTVAEAVEVWEPLHATVREALTKQDSEDVRYRLGRHIKHQQQHVDEVARLLRLR